MEKILTFVQKNIGWLIGGTLCLLFVLSTGIFWWQARRYDNILMVAQLEQLATIFKDIHATAGIVSFEHQRNHVDFLNVKKFKGSTLGSVNLLRPELWRGPYVTKNPTIQGHYYQIVRTHKGLFLTPGNGVVLSNGKIIGVDIPMDETVDLETLGKDLNQLNIGGKSLAFPIASLKKGTPENEDSYDPYNLINA